MNARIFAIAASLALGATVAQANPFEGDQAIAAKSAATSGLTRAEVQAQLVDAQKNHTMVVQGDKVAVNAYEAGKSQPSYDKQFVRDWLKAHPNSDYLLPQDVIDKTIAKYKEAYEMLTGKKFGE